MEITGKIIDKIVESRAGYQFEKLVIETDVRYPQTVVFDLNKGVDVSSFKEGESVKIDFNLKGNEYNGKYYNKLAAYRVTLI